MHPTDGEMCTAHTLCARCCSAQNQRWVLDKCGVRLAVCIAKAVGRAARFVIASRGLGRGRQVAWGGG